MEPVGKQTLHHKAAAQLARDLHAEHAHPIFDWADGTPPAPVPWPGLEKAGPGATTEIAVDDQAEAAALAYLRDPARRRQPWALNVSFIAPHFPLIVPQRFWDMYSPDDVDMPTLPSGHLAQQHAVYQRMQRMFGLIAFPEEQVRRGRAAYYGLISYLDEKVGRLLAALEETGQDRNTLVVYISDHGEMAGEHGMWRKSNFYEQSVRIPMLLRWPGVLPAGRRVSGVVSLVDLVATLVEAAQAPVITPLSGTSLLALARGDAIGWKDEAFAEYLAHGVARPMAMLRRGRFKLNYSLDDRPELFDLTTDPGEFHDLATDPDYHTVLEDMRASLLARWDPVQLEQVVRRSQRERLLIRAAVSGESAVEARHQWALAGSTVAV